MAFQTKYVHMTDIKLGRIVLYVIGFVVNLNLYSLYPRIEMSQKEVIPIVKWSKTNNFTGLALNVE